MSPSSVHQGLQSCLEPHLMEPRVLRLKLSPTGSNLSTSDTLLDIDPNEKPFTKTATSTKNEHDMKKDEDCSWSFLQSLSDICNKTEAENVYVHPTVRCSSSMLNAKSLEMCTESLGCETGSNASESSDEMSLFSSESSSCFTGDTTPTPVVVNRNSVSRRVNRGNSFPPPLTSLTDLGGVHVRPHREDGRLILEAVTSSSPQPYFQAERSNGRLRLRLFEIVASYSDDDNEEEEEASDEEESGVEVYVGNGEDEMEITKFGRPSRCKESGNRDFFGDGYYFELPPLSLCL